MKIFGDIMQISCQKRAIDNASIVSRLFKFKTPSSSKTFEIWESFVKAKKCPIPVKDIKCPESLRGQKMSLAKSVPIILYITGKQLLLQEACQKNFT